MQEVQRTSHDLRKAVTEKSNSYAMLDVSVGDKEKKTMNEQTEKIEDDNKINNKSPFMTAVIKIRKYSKKYKLSVRTHKWLFLSNNYFFREKYSQFLRDDQFVCC